MQLIVNGAIGQCGVTVPKVLIVGIKPGKEQLLNRQTLRVNHVPENLLRPDNAIPNHVISIVNGVNGVLGLNVLKVAILGMKPGNEQLLNKQMLQVNHVLENLLRPNNAMPNHALSIVCGVNGVLGVNVPKVAILGIK